MDDATTIADFDRRDAPLMGEMIPRRGVPGRLTRFIGQIEHLSRDFESQKFFDNLFSGASHLIRRSLVPISWPQGILFANNICCTAQVPKKLSY